jgi:hypothetical protein
MLKINLQNSTHKAPVSLMEGFHKQQKVMSKTRFRHALVRRSVQSGSFQSCEICSRSFDVGDLKAVRIISPKFVTEDPIFQDFARSSANGLLLCALCLHIKDELICDIDHQNISSSAIQLHNPYYHQPLLLRHLGQQGWPSEYQFHVAAAQLQAQQRRRLQSLTQTPTRLARSHLQTQAHNIFYPEQNAAAG